MNLIGPINISLLGCYIIFKWLSIFFTLHTVYTQMEPLIKDSTLRLAAKIAEFADNGEKVEVLKYIQYNSSKWTLNILEI